jgi:hypothetical protein
MISTSKRAVVLSVTIVCAVSLGLLLAFINPPPKPVILTVCGLLLPLVGLMVLVPHVDKTYGLPPWAKGTLWMLFILSVPWCGLFLLQLRAPKEPQIAGSNIAHTWLLLSGFLVGAATTLVLSGVLSKKGERVS